MASVQTVHVTADDGEQRLDRWIKKRWPSITQSRIERWCRKGEVRINGGRARASTRVVPGQAIRIPPIPDATSRPKGAREPDPPHVDQKTAKEVIDAVLYRDDQLIVLNKPPGLAVQGGSGQRMHLGALLPMLRFGREDLPRLVHRLDRDTSGVLVLARTGLAATRLGRQFRGRDVRKLYFAAVAGRPNPPNGTIRYGLVKSGSSTNEKMGVVHPDHIHATPGAQVATTHYTLVENAGNRVSWVALIPVTGRTHQLRAHMAAIGCPIAGDGKYGGRGQENLGDGWKSGLGGAFSRKLHLHAARLSFSHPTSDRAMTFKADLPDHMARTWELMGWSVADSDPYLSSDLFGTRLQDNQFGV